MLYLVRTFGRSSKSTYLKVGFTDNLEKRLREYKTQNPFFEFIGKREGDEIYEKKIHLYLSVSGLKSNFMNEWFIDSSEVYKLFHAHKDKIDKTIWKNRNILFNPSDFKLETELKYKIYQQLREKYKKPGEILKQEIDKSWLLIMNKKLIKENKKNYRLR